MLRRTCPTPGRPTHVGCRRLQPPYTRCAAARASLAPRRPWTRFCHLLYLPY